MRPVALACALAFLALSSTGSPGASDELSHLSSDPRVNHARALIERGQFGEALVVLRPLAPDHPDRTDVLFLVGLAALRAAQLPGSDDAGRTGLLDEAVAAFRAILIDRPGLVRVRLELARAFYFKGEDELSREHFERVLAGGPPAAMADNIKRFLEAMRERRRWSGHFGATLAPDSNVNAASDDRTIYIHGLPFRRDSESGAQSGLGVVLWGGGEHQYPLARQLRFRTGADIARREHAGRNFDQTSLMARAGPRWLVGRASDISLLGSARRRWTGGQPYASEMGGRLEAAHRFSRHIVGEGRAAWHRRDHDRDRHLDGSHAALSLGLLWQTTATIEVHATMGYSRERTRALVWRNSSRWARFGVSLALPYGFTVGAGGEVVWTSYTGNWAPFVTNGGAREDSTRILRGSVLNRALTVFGFSPRLVLVNEVRKSNAQLYDYRRYRAELQFVRQF